jgi:hypothetical protein
VTRSLLGWGVVAGPFYVISSIVQALTRDGFDLRRHQWSLLENGDLGWIQVANFLLTGSMLIAFAVGMRRALVPGLASRWAPILVAVFGASMVAAGVFTADPALGFPVGVPDGPGVVTTRGVVHFAAAGVGFHSIAAACFVMARRQSSDGRPGRAFFSRLTAVGFLGGFLGVASGGGSVAANLAFTAAVMLVFTWTSVTAADLYRAVTAQPGQSL